MCEIRAHASGAGTPFREIRLRDGLSDDRMQVLLRRTGLLQFMVIRDAAPSDAAALEPVIRLADPDNPDGSWRQLPTAIRQSLEADKYARVRAVEETESVVVTRSPLRRR